MNCDRMVEEIIARAGDRFEVVTDTELAELALESLTDVRALKLRRPASVSKTARTILVGYVSGANQIRELSRWSAEVRDNLLEPETSDLYLFLVADGVAQHECSRIEADEQFCRKYVASSLDGFTALLDRTFLSRLASSKEGTTLTDPVTVAFELTEKTYPWLDEAVQGKWLKVLAADRPGKDLVAELIDIEHQQENPDE